MILASHDEYIPSVRYMCCYESIPILKMKSSSVPIEMLVWLASGWAAVGTLNSARSLPESQASLSPLWSGR